MQEHYASTRVLLTDRQLQAKNIIIELVTQPTSTIHLTVLYRPMQWIRNKHNDVV